MLAVHWYGIISLLVHVLISTDYCVGQKVRCFGSDTLKVVNSTSGTISSNEVEATERDNELTCIWMLNSTFTNYRAKIRVRDGGDFIRLKNEEEIQSNMCTFTGSCSTVNNPDGCIDRKVGFDECYTDSKKENTASCRPCTGLSLFKDGKVLKSDKIYCYKTEQCDFTGDKDCSRDGIMYNLPGAIEYTWEKNKQKKIFNITYEFIDCSGELSKTTTQPTKDISSPTTSTDKLNTTDAWQQTISDKTIEGNVTGEFTGHDTTVTEVCTTNDRTTVQKNVSSGRMSNRNNTLVIALCSVGAVLLLIVIVILIIVIYRKRKKQGGNGMSSRRSEPAVSDQKEIVNNDIYNMDIAPNNEREMVDNVLYGSADPAQNQNVDNALYATAENI